MSASFLHSLLAVVHALAAAAWFGAMFYSFFVLHPRAHAYFREPAEFETFIATLSQGARWKVLGALGMIALTGFGLVFVCWPRRLAPTWGVLMMAKLILFFLAAGVFTHISWRSWPARVLATQEEIPHFQKAFRRAAVVMLAIAAFSIVLGILAHTL